jgi:uncharacterized protein YbjT (DUF2867 family)
LRKCDNICYNGRRYLIVFITAATGTVGSQVVEELLKIGAPIRAGVHSRPLEIDGVESHKIDFNRPETMAPALEGVSDLFLASYETWHEQNAVPVAQEAGVQRIVKLSAWRAADEAFIVGRWHRDVERALEDSGMVWTFLRPNMFMQNTINVMGDSIRKENSIYTGECSPVPSNVEEITGKPPILFEQFSRDYASALSPEKDAMTE